MTAAAAAKDHIRELKARYCYATDALDADALVETFVPDGVLDVEIYGTATGHAGIREYIEWFAAQPFEVRGHNVFNPVIELDGDSAAGTWYYLVLYARSDGTLDVGHGEYTDEFVRTDAGWKFASVKARRRISERVETIGRGEG